MRDDWLPPMLKEWAQWYETSSGYSDSTTLWRAIMAPTQAGFGPSIPKGVEPPHSLSKLCRAMGDLLSDHSCGEDVAIVRAFYVLGIHGVLRHAGFSERKLYERVRCGEMAIRGYLKAI